MRWAVAWEGKEFYFSENVGIGFLLPHRIDPILITTLELILAGLKATNETNNACARESNQYIEAKFQNRSVQARKHMKVLDVWVICRFRHL